MFPASVWMSYVSSALKLTVLPQSWSTCSQCVAGANIRMWWCRAPLLPSPTSDQFQVVPLTHHLRQRCLPWLPWSSPCSLSVLAFTGISRTLTDGWRPCTADEKPYKPDPVVGTPVVTTSNGHGPYAADHASTSAVNGVHSQAPTPHNVHGCAWSILPLHQPCYAAAGVAHNIIRSATARWDCGSTDQPIPVVAESPSSSEQPGGPSRISIRANIQQQRGQRQQRITLSMIRTAQLLSCPAAAPSDTGWLTRCVMI